MNKGTLKAVVIGASGHFRFATDAIAHGADCEITAAAPGPEGDCDIVNHIGLNVPAYDDYLEMLEAEKPDVAIINPQFDRISECAIEAIERGINVFCEKPLALSWTNIKAIEEALEGRKVRVCAMMGMRFEPTFAALNRLIKNDELGKIRLIHAQKSYKLGSRKEFYHNRKTYGGTIPWVGSHAIDMIYWLMGRKKYKSVSALHSVAGNNNHGELESFAAMLFEMQDEVFCTVNIDYLRPQASTTHGDDRIRIVGERNWAEIINNKLYLGEKEQRLIEEKNIFYHFCEELKGEGLCEVSNQDSIYVTKICLFARDAADTCRRIKIG